MNKRQTIQLILGCLAVLSGIALLIVLKILFFELNSITSYPCLLIITYGVYLIWKSRHVRVTQENKSYRTRSPQNIMIDIGMLILAIILYFLQSPELKSWPAGYVIYTMFLISLAIGGLILSILGLIGSKRYYIKK